jgi:hypothetical protein
LLKRGRTQKGLSGFSIIFRPSFTIPGDANGIKWLGEISPALPMEQQL